MGLLSSVELMSSRPFLSNVFMANLGISSKVIGGSISKRKVISGMMVSCFQGVRAIKAIVHGVLSISPIHNPCTSAAKAMWEKGAFKRRMFL